MNVLKCEPAIAVLSEIVDKTAPFWMRFQFHLHMLMCSQCRVYYRQFKELKSVASQDPFPIEELPGDFFKIMEESLLTQFPNPTEQTNSPSATESN